MNTLPFSMGLILLLLTVNPITEEHVLLADQVNAGIKKEGGAAVHKEILIDLGQQMIFLLEDGTLVNMYPISTGKAWTPTPIGEFQVYRKQELRISSQAVPYRMPYYISFTKNGSHGIHALPYLGLSPASSRYWAEALDHIGIPVSHGCVRLLPDDAFALYEWAEVGIPVTIAATTAVGEYMRAEREEREEAQSAQYVL